MNFIKQGTYWAISECGRYSICRANLLGGGAYTAARLGTRRTGRAGESWDGSVLLLSERYEAEDDDGRVAAYRACVNACQADAAGREAAGSV